MIVSGGKFLSFSAKVAVILTAGVVVLKAVFLEQQPQHHLGTCKKCSFSGPTQTPWIRYSGGQGSEIGVFSNSPGVDGATRYLQGLKVFLYTNVLINQEK